MKYDLTTGRAVGAAVPEHFGVGANWLDGIRKWAKAGASILPALALGFTTDTYLKGDEFAPNFVELSDFSRASKAWEANWDGKSGSEVGWLKEYGVDERRVGSHGPTIEAASTNQTSNARLEGAVVGVVGSGGAVPTGLTNAQGPATLEVLGSGVENGWSYVELEYTTTGSAFPQLYFGTPSSYSAASGETWTTSCGLRLLASSGSFLGLQVRMREYAGVTITNDTLASDYVAADGAHRRFKHTATLSDGATDNALGGVLLGFSGAGSARFKLYVPQFEEAADATSPILPTAGTPAATTRAADIVTGVTTDRSSRGWYDTQWDYTDGGLVGDLLEFLPGVPRIGPKGLLVEEAATNQFPNPRFEGGTSSAFPTGLSEVANYVLGSASLSYGTQNGWPYMEIAITGAVSSGQIFLVGSSDVPAGAAQDWTCSFGVAVVSGNPADAAINIRLRSRDSGSTSLTNDDSADLDATRVHKRFFHTAETPASTAYVQPSIRINTTAAVTIRIYAPQLEQTAYPTSIVLPEAGVPAAATRASEDIQLDGAGWLGTDGVHTMIGEYVLNAINGVSIGYAMTLTDGTSDENMTMGYTSSSGGRARSLAVAGGGQVYNETSNTNVAVGQVIRQAFAIDATGGASSVNGSNQDTDSGGLPMPTHLQLGAYKDASGLRPPSVFIQRFTYLNIRESDATLEALVA